MQRWGNTWEIMQKCSFLRFFGDSWARAFGEKFCPGVGLLTTSKRFPGGLPGGCWRLELTDA